MKYVQFINNILKKTIEKENNLVIFGQNVDAASCLSGLTRGLGKVNNGLTLNTQNSENTLVGVGFGLMLNNTSSIYFMKQQDFLLLGIDHLVNTYNVIRQKNVGASFTIFPVIVDSGYEGPQSALNNFNDFCSIARVDGYSFTNEIDTEKIISKYLVEPGLRIIGASQRLLKQEMLNLEVVFQDKDCRYFQYAKGTDVSIVCFNYSIPYGNELKDVLSDKNLSSSLFSINTYTEFDFSFILDDIEVTNNLIIIDDTKSANRLSDKFISQVNEVCKPNRILKLTRSFSEDWFSPRHDLLEINYDEVAEQFC
jgi:pyruvate/2-oxoglutarate/acetoin dehydrogenase E1 component